MVERIDADFARGVLRELYAYRTRSLGLARLLWLCLGLLGGHRFYLGRPWTALLMMFSLGGGFVWWVVDGFLIRRMISDHNDEQARRRAAGLPPLELAFMPALTDDVLRQPPLWTREWRLRSSRRRLLRFAGDFAVLVIAAFVLGALADYDGAEEAVLAILVVAGITAAGGATGWLDRIPGVRSVVRWSHRLRLFYYYNEPGSPLSLLLRPVVGVMLAPFRPRDRTEVRLYLQLGFVFTLGFLLLDVFPFLIEPVIRDGVSAAAPGALIGQLVGESVVTFLLIYSFAAPIGAVLTTYMLTHRTHFVPRILCATTLAAIAAGVLVSR